MGDSALGRRLLAYRGSRAMKLHGPHILKQNQPKAVRASVIARNRRKAREALDRDRARGAPLPVSPRSRSYLVLVL